MRGSALEELGPRKGEGDIEMLHTTFRKAQEAGVCHSEYTKMAKALGGIKEYGENTPVPLDKILDVCGLDVSLWSLRCIIEPADKEIRVLACDFAGHTLHIFEEKHPNNKRPRQVIEISRKFSEGKATREELDAARDAIWDAGVAVEAAAWDAGDDIAGIAARAAARAAAEAARDAAGDAAYVIERQWQEQKFREMLNSI